MYRLVLASTAVTLDTTPLSGLVLSFFLYSFIGWAWESSVCALANRGHFANSGFLLGPYCPIYGVGGTACWLLLRGIESNFILFLTSAVLCCALEYVAAVMLEHFTHARFWDYSDFPLNIQGRICLYGALLFGAGAVLICRVVQPLFLYTLEGGSPYIVITFTLLLTGVLVIDMLFSIASWKRLSSQLEQLRGGIAERIDDELAAMSESLGELMPDSLRNQAASLQSRGQAANGWLCSMSDTVLDMLRDTFDMELKLSEDGLIAALMRLGKEVSAPRSVKLWLSRRELRFFNAFSHLRLLPYEGVIRLTGLTERARSFFQRKKAVPPARSEAQELEHSDASDALAARGDASDNLKTSK
ncbi:putative ABC transporter permease [Collinsella sp. zg1085]|uniref:putative ABC transporter permease n=1 Tax=Collinsella sp. zg1085 TaxID=2844380 RepID=UPI001C0C4838|nr:putative ABC transporter permease [Collinsella sp. zg1085]QWT17857.1 putative ABC transporter permease [Collinsella sp. zg1085]